MIKPLYFQEFAKGLKNGSSCFLLPSVHRRSPIHFFLNVRYLTKRLFCVLSPACSALIIEPNKPFCILHSVQDMLWIVKRLGGNSMKKTSGFFIRASYDHAGGVFLLLSFVLPRVGIALPIDPAWITVIVSGIPLLYLAVWRILHNPESARSPLPCSSPLPCLQQLPSEIYLQPERWRGLWPSAPFWKI